MSTTNSEDNFENACVVCFKNVEIFSIGDCDHPVCYECSTRMRVLCRQNECPICRQDMTKVVFTQDVRPFKELKNGTYLMDKKFQICFDSPDIQRAYNALLAHVCSKCHGRHAFQNFISLREHMRREHELHYCDLCVDNLMILTCERRCYTRQELAQHRRRGDPDDRSHKGHPLCEFCDKRYMDNDELYRHLRRDHLFCHFCDTDGLHQYYSSYDFLREHFRREHYLCEEGNCYEEKFTAVFRSEIDLKAHRASVHGRMIGKAAAKQARTLELEFTLAPRPRDGRDRGRGGQRNVRLRPEYREEEEGAVGGMYIDCHTTPQYMNPPASQINTDCIDEFPSLGGNSASTQRPSSRKTSGLTIRAGLQGGRGLAVTDENFPALGPEATLSLRVNSSSSGERPISSIVTSKPTNVSIHVNHRPSSGVGSSVVTTRVSSSQNVRLKEKDPFPALSNQFPALSNTKMSAPVASTVSTQWSSGKESESKLSLVKNKSPTQPPPKPPQPKTFHIEDDFPSLNGRFETGCNVKQEVKPPDTKNKKSSSISIPVADSWSSVTKETMNGYVSSDSEVGNKKNGKKKKKKTGTKNASSSNNSSGNDTKLNTATKKVNSNKAIPEKDKKKKQKDETNKIEAGKKRQENQENEKPGSALNERKRSELMIGKLVGQSKSQPEIKMDGNDFPVLGKSHPPGFSEPSKAPPGFESANSKSTPPPGFSITLNSVARPPSNGLTFTSSSGQSYPINPGSSIPSSAYVYVPPSNFNQRNGDLVDRMMAALKNPGELDEFRQMSSAYRQNLITAKCYYGHCQAAMGTETFGEIFPELIVLLPDIEKQQELWSIYQVSDRPKSSSKLDVCATCSQVISTSDLRHHMMSHTLENHFPALANGTVQANNAWVKK